MAAEILWSSFRLSDVIGRLAGDEFAVVAVDASGSSESALIDRLHYFSTPSTSGPRCRTTSR